MTFTDPTALHTELANYHREYGLPAATPECVASLIDDTDPGDDPQRQGLDKLAAQTITGLVAVRDRLAAEVNRLRAAMEEVLGHAGTSVAQRAPSDDKIIAEHIEAVRDIARATLAGKRGG